MPAPPACVFHGRLDSDLSYSSARDTRGILAPFAEAHLTNTRLSTCKMVDVLRLSHEGGLRHCEMARVVKISPTTGGCSPRTAAQGRHARLAGAGRQSRAAVGLPLERPLRPLSAVGPPALSQPAPDTRAGRKSVHRLRRPGGADHRRDDRRNPPDSDPSRRAGRFELPLLRSDLEPEPAELDWQPCAHPDDRLEAACEPAIAIRAASTGRCPLA